MSYQVQGAGLGLKQELIAPLLSQQPSQIRFVEVAPENWIHVGGARGKSLDAVTERYPLVCHGLSLNIGGPAPLDWDLLRDIKRFLQERKVLVYTEHLSYCGDSGQLYDLMPIPFTEDAVHYVADRIRQVQDYLGRQIGMENVSTYAQLPGELSEIEFLNAVLTEADCGYHLDINNIFVNASNHRFDALDYLHQIPADRLLYAHIAGHNQQTDGLRIDTHGEDILPDVWDLLEDAYTEYGVFPTLLERDFNIPPLETLMDEVRQICRLQRHHATTGNARAA
ncbi:MAG: DUF692 domain-containing protein [Pseudomonadota bacterium]